MRVEVTVPVNAPKADVWRVVSDIENAADTISGIEEIEILRKPTDGLVGLKWRETRTLFGKTATEIIWVTAAVEGDNYLTEARSHGSIYRSKIKLSEQGGTTQLSMIFGAEPQSLAARLMSVIMGFVFKRATRKALLTDLNDIEAAAERSSGAADFGSGHHDD